MPNIDSVHRLRSSVQADFLHRGGLVLVLSWPSNGVWAQDSNGANTSYGAENAEGFLQLGEVTPAGGKGVLQLVAESFSDLTQDLDGAELEFLSVGAEIYGSEIDECPDSPIFTFPE
jgi:hypothetical protein